MAYSEKNRQEAIKLFKKGLERIEKNSKDGWENEFYRQFRESVVGLEMQNTWKYKSDAVYDSKFYKHTKTKKGRHVFVPTGFKEGVSKKDLAKIKELTSLANVNAHSYKEVTHNLIVDNTGKRVTSMLDGKKERFYKKGFVKQVKKRMKETLKDMEKLYLSEVYNEKEKEWKGQRLRSPLNTYNNLYRNISELNRGFMDKDNDEAYQYTLDMMLKGKRDTFKYVGEIIKDFPLDLKAKDLDSYTKLLNVRAKKRQIIGDEIKGADAILEVYKELKAAPYADREKLDLERQRTNVKKVNTFLDRRNLLDDGGDEFVKKWKEVYSNLVINGRLWNMANLFDDSESRERIVLQVTTESAKTDEVERELNEIMQQYYLPESKTFTVEGEQAIRKYLKDKFNFY